MIRLWRLVTYSVLALPALSLAQNQFVIRAQQGGNITQVANGSTLSVGSPAPGDARTLKILVTYIGSTSVSFPDGAIALGSPDFTAQLSARDRTLAPYQTGTVDVVFTPAGSGLALAQLDLRFVESAPPGTPVAQPTRGLLTLTLAGSVPSYSLVYSIGSGGNATTVPANGSMIFPDTVINTPVTATVSLINRGSGAGQVNAVSLSGSAFAVAGLPALPVTLNPSGTLSVQVVYLPRQPGSDDGSLKVEFEGGISQTYRLHGQAVLSQLSYELLQPDGSVNQLTANQVIEFAQTFLGDTKTLQIRFTNRMTANYTLSTVSTTGPSFTVSNSPGLPLTLPPAASGSLTVSFSPSQSDRLSGSLQIGSDRFDLAGSGRGLPDYTISGPAEAGALEQPVIGLTFSQPYPVALTGTLNLGVASDYAADPSAQFSTGGRMVSFTIPANSARAVFPNGASEIRLQTGSVASRFTVTPTFSTREGLDLTPESPTVLQLTVPATAPRLLGIQVVERESTSLTLRVTGFAPVRSLSKMDVRFTAAAGFNVPNLTLTIDLTGASTLWFSSATSQQYGGQFSLNVQFLLGTSDTAATPTQGLQTVSVDVANSAGESNAVTLNLQ